MCVTHAGLENMFKTGGICGSSTVGLAIIDIKDLEWGSAKWRDV